MKRFLSVTCILLLAALIMSVALGAAAPAKKTYATVSRLSNLRQGPSDLDNVLAILQVGTRVEIIIDGGSWLLVNTPSGKGYIARVAISFDAYYGSIMQDAVLYSQKDLNAIYTLKLLPAGTRVKLVYFENGWYSVQASGASGFVRGEVIARAQAPSAGNVLAGVMLHSESLRKNPDRSSSAQATPGANAIVTVYEILGEYVRAQSDNQTGYLPLSAVRVYFSDSLLYSKPVVELSTAAHKSGKIVSTTVQNYGYDLMIKELNQLKKRFPDLVKIGILGKSTAGRDIPIIRVGNTSARRQIWVDASIHAREYMATQIVLDQVEFILNNYSKGVYDGRKVSTLLNNVCLNIVPMANPDGVELSQRGLASVASPEEQAYLLALNGGKEDFSKWKANIRGVDLNANFNADWDKRAEGVQGPEGYKGAAPFSEVETQLISKYLLGNKMNMTISYHASGSELYWWYGQSGQLEERDFGYAAGFAKLTGYTLVSKNRSIESMAGLKDWAVKTFKTPGFTVELGPTPSRPPILIEYYPSIFECNKYVLLHAMNLVVG